MQEYIDNKIKEIEESLEKEFYVSINMSVCADYFVKASSVKEARKKAQFEFETQDVNFPDNWDVTDSDRESEFYVEDLTERRNRHNINPAMALQNHPVAESWEV